ncbi:MAG: endonuclease/exonuclease/phosphatase family protein [Rhodopirellula sp. JB055]|uniref:endonuclease/exonuclease/phosphatase family protein n=1 Tax=Rhodopirellula sp. JB055 TaxID=3342846 RepID=UPI00370AC29D
MENDEFDHWSKVVRQTDADVVIAAEIDQRWKASLDGLKSIYPHQIVYPQDNWYGMAMLSRLPFRESEIRFRVQDDVPSIDTMIELPSGEAIRVIGVHPRPPEPIRDNDATARDAELVLWGKELAEDHRPIVIGGDLNDVAWSPSTRLFLRLSQLLDPRRGRGFYNTFHADHLWMRFPLDHVFHSPHFTIRGLKRLEHVGSDHFPILIDLQLQPVLKDEQEPLEEKAKDEKEAELKLQRAAESDEIEAVTTPLSSHAEILHSGGQLG